MELLEQAGLVGRADGTGPVRERFRGRLIFPIHDDRGRTVGFGGRILPRVERAMAEQGRHVAKYLNTPETALFRKRTLLYGADLARAAARQAGWVAVVEGYTDVIAAHQAGLENVVGTLGTALGEDHIGGLRRLADRVVLVFDGDEAGMSAADRSLELFLGHEIDLRVLTLPAGLDPCDFLLQRGAAAFRELAERATDPLAYLLDRAADAVRLQLGRGRAAGRRMGAGHLELRPGQTIGSGSRSRWTRSWTGCRSASACPRRRSSECGSSCRSSPGNRPRARRDRRPGRGRGRGGTSDPETRPPARTPHPRRPRSGWTSSTGPTWS